MNTKHGAWLAVGLSLGLLPGCEDEAAAQQKCEAFARAFCEKVVSCAQSENVLAAGDTAAALYADCETEAENSARCSQVVRITPSYDECLEDSQNLDCSLVGPALAMSQLPVPKTCAAFLVYSDN